MNMTRKRSPRKKRNDSEIHFDTMWWIFSNAILGILLINLSHATSISLQNETQQNPAQEQKTNNSKEFLSVTVSNKFKADIPKNDSMNSDELSINRTLDVNITDKKYDLQSDNATNINAANNSNVVEIHIRVIDKTDPLNGAPLLNVDAYKYSIVPEITTQYEMVYNTNYGDDLDISTTEFEIITNNDIYDNDSETNTPETTTNEAITDSSYNINIGENEKFKNRLLNIESTEKMGEDLLRSTTFGSRLAVTAVTPQTSKENIIHNVEFIKNKENVTTRNVVFNNNDCQSNEKCRNDTSGVKVGEVLNVASSDFVKIALKPPQISTENSARVESNNEENMVENVEINSHKRIKSNKDLSKNSTKYLKKEQQHSTKKYFPPIVNDKSKHLKNSSKDGLIPSNVTESFPAEIMDSEATTAYSDSEDVYITTTEEVFEDTRKNSSGINGESRNKTAVATNVTVKGDLDYSSKIVDVISNNTNGKDNTTHESVKYNVKYTDIISGKLQNTTQFNNKNISKDFSLSTKIVDDINNETSFKTDLKNTTTINVELKNMSSDSIKNITSVKMRKKNKTISETKHNSHEVTTEEDYNSSYEMEEEDDDESLTTKNKSMKEPFDMGPFSAIRDLAGSIMGSLVERMIPKTIRDLMKRMQNQNDQLETIKLRSREENGGLGQFGRSLLKGLTQPLNQWMQGVRDYGSLDSDRNFFSDVASGVASVADSVGDSFKDRVKAIFPGTLWCGDGDMAKSAEVGLFFMTDDCCRRHDTCRLYIVSGDTKYGLTNTGLFTRSHCECDKAFYRCLKRTNSLVSSQIGVTYFSILGPQCFKREYPIIRCKTRTRITGQKCEEYELDYSQPKNVAVV